VQDARPACRANATNNTRNNNNSINKNNQHLLSQNKNFFQSIFSLCSIFLSAVTGSSVERPFISVNANGVKNSWLFDSGASVSCMSIKEFRKIPLEKRPPKLPHYKQLTSASKDTLKVSGVYNLTLTIHGREIVHPVYVCDNLHQNAILGIDAITKLGICYSTARKVFFYETAINFDKVNNHKMFPGCNSEHAVASLSTVHNLILPPFTTSVVRLSSLCEGSYRPPAGATGVAQIHSITHPALFAAPGLVQTDRLSEVSICLQNCSPSEVRLERNTPIGFVEFVSPSLIRQVDADKVINEISSTAPHTPTAISEKRRASIHNDLVLSVPLSERSSYVDLILKNHDVFSETDLDLGRANNFEHVIDIKNSSPVYVKQFRIPDSHRPQLEKQIDDWLKMGIIQPSNSRYNSPIFAVPKKNGAIRWVLDYRQLNSNSHDDRYSMKTVDECIGDIGRSGSTIFSTIDLSSGFHQMLLNENSRKFTAFTCPPLGQFEWLTTSMGLKGACSSFQRMVELTLKNIRNIVIYIDDILCHNSTHAEHRKTLQQVFDRLRKTNLKINLKKCHFGSTNVSFLGFRLTPEGILPGSDKLKAVRDAPPPANVHQIRQFLGLVNFFRNHVRNFARVSSPLTKLTRKDVRWRGGPLPPEALQSYQELKTALCSNPIVAYPRQSRPFSLIVDAATGTPSDDGGLGAILCQTDEHGEFHVIAYASRALSKHEKNYTPFLLEMQACVWGIDHFDAHLRGRKFVLYTDHKPLEKLSNIHTKTLNRLQQAMTDYDFIIQYKEGKDMPADFLSRNVLAPIEVFDYDLRTLQRQDDFASSILQFWRDGGLPSDGRKARYVQQLAPQCFIEKGILWRRLRLDNMPPRTVLVLPHVLADALIHQTHDSLFAGHEGIAKTKNRLLQSYFWPAMDKEIGLHIASCRRCQARRTDHPPPRHILTPMPQCTAMNQRVCFDLMGPLRTSSSGKKFVLCITDAFTKYAEMVAVDNKEAPTVARAIFERWICRFGTPLEFYSDNGREFCNELSKELFKLLKIEHNTTTPYFPSSNGQAEIQNKTIARYLASFVDNTTLDWPLYMAPMQFAYNTSVHRSLKTTPYFLTYGTEPRYPLFPNPDVQRYYGESTAAEWYHNLQHCRQLAAENNMQATDQMKSYADRAAKPHSYTRDQQVWLNEHQFGGRNRKLSPKWLGPYPILRVLPAGVVDLQLPRRKLRVNISRLKPFVPARPASVLPAPPNIHLPGPALPRPGLPAASDSPAVLCRPHPPFPQPRPIALPPPPIVAPPAGPITRAVARARGIVVPPVFGPGWVQAAADADPFIWHHAIASGPLLLTDHFGLPIVKKGCVPPSWIAKRRKFLRSLSTAERNYLLTGDTNFPYDNVPLTAGVDFAPPAVPVPAPPLPVPPPPVPVPAPVVPVLRVPPVIVDDNVSPDVLIADESLPHNFVFPSSSSSSSSAPSPPAPRRSYDFRSPVRPVPSTDSSSCSNDDPTAAPSPPPLTRPRGRPPAGPDVPGATALINRWAVTEHPGGYWLRSSPEPAPVFRPPVPRTSSWHRALQRGLRMTADLLTVPNGPGMSNNPPVADAVARHNAAWAAAQPTVAQRARRFIRSLDVPGPGMSNNPRSYRDPRAPRPPHDQSW